MATGTASRGASPKPSKAGVQADQRERFIETQLRKTRNQVRSVELTTRLLVLMVGVVVYFLVVSLIDHWIVPGGMGIWTRLLCLAVLLIGGAVYLFQQIVPLFLYRVNSVYAAHTIERTKPSLKNSLVNFLMLRSHRSDVPEVVFSAIEEQAATNLSATSIDHAVDRGKVIQLGYVLIGIVAVFCLYFILSPKSPLQTVGRVVLPWADISPASRVVLRDIQPGRAVVYRGEHVAISAEISSLRENEPVRLIYSTADRQLIDQTVEMKVDDTGLRYIATLPQMESTSIRTPQNGVQQDIDYRIEAGDAISSTYRLTVVQAPNILVDRLEYNYPAYVGRSREIVEQTGDLSAIEGTRVTIHATANQPIKSAYIDFEADGRNKKSMTVKGDKATATFELALNQQRSGPQFASYVVRFINESDKSNREPIRYRIEVTPDYAPDISILEPSKSVTEVPLNGDVTFKVQASDPDFALAKVKLIAKVQGRSVLDHTFFPTADEKLYSGKFLQQFSLRFDQLAAATTRLQPGDEVVYWAEATDNKSPHANVSKTAERKIKLLAPLANQPANRRESDPTNKEKSPQRPRDPNNPDQENRTPENGEEAPPKEENESNPKNTDDPAQETPKKDDPNKADPKRSDPGEQEPKTDTEGTKKPEQGTPEDSRQDQNSEQEQQPSEAGGAEAKQNEGGGESKSKTKSGQQSQDQPGGTEGGDPREGGVEGGANENSSSANNTEAGKPGTTGSTKSEDNQSGTSSGEQTSDDTETPEETGPEGATPEGSRPEDATSGEQRGDPRPVAKEGDDGAALERALQDLEEQTGKTREQLIEEMEKHQAEQQAKEEGTGGDNAQQSGESDGARKPGAEGPKKDTPAGSDQERGNGGKDELKKPGEQKRGKDETGTSGATDDPANPDKGAAGADKAGTEEKKATGKQEDPATGDSTESGKTEKSGTEQNPTDPAAAGSEPSAKPKPDAAKSGTPSESDPKSPGEDNESGDPSKTKKPGDPANKSGGLEGEQKDPKAAGEPGETTPDGDKTDEKKTEEPKSDAENTDPASSEASKSSDPSGKSQEKQGDKESKTGETKPGGAQKDPRPDNKETDQSGDPSTQEPESPAATDKDSDAKGQESGGKSGKGKRGGGQNDNRAGKGAAGTNTEADEGAKDATTPGESSDNTTPGDGSTADGQTGNAGKAPGDGSKNRKTADKKPEGIDPTGPAKDEPTGSTGKESDSTKTDKSGKSGSPSSDANSEQKFRTDETQGFGKPGDVGPPPTGRKVDPQQDDANLEYARKATDLALEHIRDQLKDGEPDQELLDSLGWSKEDLQRLVERWERIENEAKAKDADKAAQQNYEEALRSLGLKPVRTSQKGNSKFNDGRRGLREEIRTQPPSEYIDQFRAFNKGASRGR